MATAGTARQSGYTASHGQQYGVVHRAITCDGCGASNFYGRRYKCLDCEDFDFCANCKNTLSVRWSHAQDHEFFAIDRPDNLEGYNFAKMQRQARTIVQGALQRAHTGIYCNGCFKQNFTGIRFKCLDCDSYDLCSQCEGSPEARSRHPCGHPLWPIAVPNDLRMYDQAVRQYEDHLHPPPSVIHTGITCDVCHTHDVAEVRFKCMDCEDYDLCKTCHSSPLCRNQHDLLHTFWPVVEAGNLHDFEIAKRARAQRIERTRPAPPQPAQPQHQGVHYNVSCQGCRVSPILGVRWKCIDCDDFDFCVTCASSPSKRDEHPMEHVFYPVTIPDDLTAFVTARSRRTTGDAAPPPYTIGGDL